MREDILQGVRHSVRKKLMLVVLATTFVALLLMGAAMMVYDVRTYQDSLVGDMFAQADLLGRASAPALAFDDEKVARENLSLLKDRPKVLAAAIYTAAGVRFASYARADLPPPVYPARAEAEGYRIEGRELVLFKRIESNHETVGTVYFRTRYELLERLQNYLLILVVVVAASLAAAVLMTSWLQKSLTQPILAMTGVARQVMTQRDFSLRVARSTEDEIGYLVDTFNAMLEEIGGRTQALEASNRSLEQEMLVRRSAETALREADRQKDQFLATLAHELRNPLAPLLNALEMLRQPGSDGRASLATREMMERQLRQLVRLVNDLLDVSRITTGKVVLQPQPHVLGDLVRAAMEATLPLITARGHQFTQQLPTEPIRLMADGTRIVQVFVNLLNNAAKFTDPGGHIGFTVEAGPGTVDITVSDNGIGITETMLPLIFEMFAQADQSLERAQAGLGVGLSLARQLVVLHGGSITAHSAGLGHGSCFVVHLPILPHGEAEAAQPAGTAGMRTGALRILLADDNVDFASSMATLLEYAGHTVAVAHDGIQALELAPSFRPAVCLLDIGLPRMHGYALAQHLRELPATRHAMLVAISGWGQPDDKRRAREAGFDHHVAKPVDFSEIQALLEVFAASHDGTQ